MSFLHQMGAGKASGRVTQPRPKRGDRRGSWVWFDHWADEVISYCEAEGDRYR